jgi:hypothetical protein
MKEVLKMDFFSVVWNEMLQGNFSFLILIASIIQIFIMLKRK